MIRITILISILALFFSTSTFAQKHKCVVNRAFKDGEKLVYIADYKVGIINVDIATIDFTVRSDVCISTGRDSYKLNAVAKVLPEFRWFFDMKDDYYVWIDKTTLRPTYFENFIKEGDYTLNGKYWYDWDSMKVKTYENRPVWKESKEKEFDLTENSLDALSLLYNLRNIDIDNLEPNIPHTLQVVFANKVRHVQYRYIGKEMKRIRGLGKINTIKVICKLANSSGETFEDGDEFELWLSDDGNMIPLYIDTPIMVGSVRCRLIRYENLATPFNK